MIKPDPQVTKALASVVRQYPDVLAWLEQWENLELHRLPTAVNNTAVFQGRCQVLGELVKFAKEAPAIAAKL
jgi:hypothetical protein